MVTIATSYSQNGEEKPRRKKKRNDEGIKESPREKIENEARVKEEGEPPPYSESSDKMNEKVELNFQKFLTSC